MSRNFRVIRSQNRFPNIIDLAWSFPNEIGDKVYVNRMKTHYNSIMSIMDNILKDILSKKGLSFNDIELDSSFESNMKNLFADVRYILDDFERVAINLSGMNQDNIRSELAVNLHNCLSFNMFISEISSRSRHERNNIIPVIINSGEIYFCYCLFGEVYKDHYGPICKIENKRKLYGVEYPHKYLHLNNDAFDINMTFVNIIYYLMYISDFYVSVCSKYEINISEGEYFNKENDLRTNIDMYDIINNIIRINPFVLGYKRPYREDILVENDVFNVSFSIRELSKLENKRLRISLTPVNVKSRIGEIIPGCGYSLPLVGAGLDKNNKINSQQTNKANRYKRK